MTDPVHNLGHGSHDVTRRQYRPINQNDWNLQESSRFELRLGTASAGVLGDDDLDPEVDAAAEALRRAQAVARAKGFLQVSASPLTRSSYHAGDDFARLRDARAARLGAAAQDMAGQDMADADAR